MVTVPWSGNLMSKLRCMVVHRITSFNDEGGPSTSGKGILDFNEFEREIQGTLLKAMVQTPKGTGLQKKNGKVVVSTSGEARFSGLGMTPKQHHFLGFSAHQSCALVHRSSVSNAWLKAYSSLG
ncbi:hypothetical protein DVH24_016798 [Malus domestica]|uniref:Uncharacterized protein n=1 Tax=Malus domestica TaxID=3750 RepID=A0A498HR83_MALDO|nr:hypothetical protein DVH24_016798 [Malus domestica]